MCGPFSNLQNLGLSLNKRSERMRRRPCNTWSTVLKNMRRRSQGTDGFFMSTRRLPGRGGRVRWTVGFATRRLQSHGTYVSAWFAVAVVKKPITFLTTSRALAEELEVKCTNDFKAIGVPRQTDKGHAQGWIFAVCILIDRWWLVESLWMWTIKWCCKIWQMLQ